MRVSLFRLAGLLPMLALPLLATACGDGDGAQEARVRTGPPVVACVNYPLAWFTETLAADEVQVHFDVPAGHDPAFWKPGDDEVATFQEADLIVRNGANYARWMKTVSLPSSRILDTSAIFADELISIGGGVTHSHGPGGDHDHGDMAFTTWLDFGLAWLQADAIAEALSGRDLVPVEEVAQSRTRLRTELEALDARMKALGKRHGERPLLASHPVYQYLARAYGLNLKSEHFEPGSVPTDEALEILGSMLKNYKATLMLWEEQPLPETVRKLEALGVRSVVFDPCGNRPEAGDFLSVMKANVERLEKALAQ